MPESPLAGVTVIAMEQAVAVPFATQATGRPGREGHQDRAAGRRGFRAWVRHDRERAGEPFRLAEPLEGIADARSETARGPGRAGAPARARRCVRAEPRARRRRSPRAAHGRPARQASAAHRLQPQRLRIDRSVRDEEGLRPAGAERGRPGVDYRHARHAVEGRLVDRRYRGRHVRLLRHSDGACFSGIAPAQGTALEVSLFEALGEWMGYAMYYTMGGTAPARTGASHATIAPYGPYRTRDGQVIFGIQTSREWTAFCTHALRLPALLDDERFQSNHLRVQHREAMDAEIDRVFGSLSTEDVVVAPRRGPDRQRAHQHRRTVHRSSAAGRPGRVAAGGVAARADPRARAAGPHGRRRAGDGRDSRARRTLRARSSPSSGSTPRRLNAGSRRA